MAPCMVFQDCGCPNQGTFDSAWLQKNIPDVYDAYKQYTFTTPEVTYPECTAVITQCMPGQKLASIFKNGIISFDTEDRNDLEDVTCEDGSWSKGKQSVMDNFFATNYSCVASQ